VKERITPVKNDSHCFKKVLAEFEGYVIDDNFIWKATWLIY